MSLDDLKKKIYHPDAGKELENRLKNEGKEYKKQKKEWGSQNKGFNLTPRSVLFVTVLISFVLIGFGIYRWARFSPEKIQMKIQGLEKAPGGKILEMKVLVKNNNRQTLKNASLGIDYPPLTYNTETKTYKDKQSISVGNIKPGGKIEISKKVRLLSPPYEKATTKARLSFRVEKKEASKSTELTTRITSSPIKITIRKPRRLVQGQSALFKIYYSNTGNFDFPESRLRLRLPEEMKINYSSPKPIAENTWSLGKIPAGQDGTITISLTPLEKMASARLQAIVESKFKEKFTYYAETNTSQEVSPPPLAIDQTINKVIIYWDQQQTSIAKSRSDLSAALNERKRMELEPMDTIKEDFLGKVAKVMLNIENTTETTFQDITITASPTGELLDRDWFTTERLGKVSDDKSKITWTKEKITPHEKDSFGFYVELSENLPLSVYKDKNALLARASINTDSIPLGWQGIKIGSENLATLKLATEPKIVAKVAPRESPLYSTGPIPPVIKKKTIYPVVWEIFNTYNDLRNCKIKAEIPDHIQWTESYFPTEENLSYNDITDEIIWEPAQVSYGTGYISEPRRAYFQVQLTPTENQYGQNIPLIKKTTLSCKDDFTEKEIQTEANQVKTRSKARR